MKINQRFGVVVCVVSSMILHKEAAFTSASAGETDKRQNVAQASIKDALNFPDRSFMTTADTIQQWHVLKDAGGPTLSGSPSWKSYATFLEEKYRECGMIDVKRDTITYNRWFTSDDRKTGSWTLSIGGKDVPVASYWAYSGSTPSSGIAAPLVYYDAKNPPASIEGKIVVLDTPSLPEPLPPEMLNPAFEYASDAESLPTDSFTMDQFYQVNYYARFSGWKEILTNGKAAGALVISKMGPARAAGVYTLPPPPAEFGVPGLYLDRVAGQVVRQSAKEGHTATLKLIAMREKAETYFLSGCLPGKNYGEKNDEMILLLAHTDGPAISQENGGLGILAVLEYFSHIPRSERPRTLLVVLDPQHYMPGRHSVDWFKLHPEIADKIVASFAIEHLGQVEYREKGDDFLPTGLPEVTQLFVQDNDLLIKWAIKAVKDNQLPRTMVQCPPRKGQGRWQGMGDVAIKRNIPGYALSAFVSAYWSTEARINKFDKDLMWKQVAVAAQLTGALMKADLKAIDVRKRVGTANDAIGKDQLVRALNAAFIRVVDSGKLRELTKPYGTLKVNLADCYPTPDGASFPTSPTGVLAKILQKRQIRVGTYPITGIGSANTSSRLNDDLLAAIMGELAKGYNLSGPIQIIPVTVNPPSGNLLFQQLNAGDFDITDINSALGGSSSGWVGSAKQIRRYIARFTCTVMSSGQYLQVRNDSPYQSIDDVMADKNAKLCAGMLSSQLANAYFSPRSVVLPEDDINVCGQGVLDGTYNAYVHFSPDPVKPGLRVINTEIVSGVPLWVAGDPDQDQDGIPDYRDNCTFMANQDQTDVDVDGVGDVCDNCPNTPNGPERGTCIKGSIGTLCKCNCECGNEGVCSMNQEDTNANRIGDACEPR